MTSQDLPHSSASGVQEHMGKKNDTKVSHHIVLLYEWFFMPPQGNPGSLSQ